jgi:hypothetical protein
MEKFKLQSQKRSPNKGDLMEKWMMVKDFMN